MPPEDSDETRRLLEEARAGEERSVGLLLDRHRAYLRRLVEVRLDPRLRARVDPSDLVQEAQMEAARRLGRYLADPAMPFRLWLRQLAYDRLLKAHRRHVRAARRTVEREAVLPEGSSLSLGQQLLHAASPSQQMTREEIAARVRAAVGRLREEDREVILLRAFEGLSNQEVARLLGVRPENASQRYGRALLRLRKLLLRSGLSGGES